jgi:hypothetical protein
VINNLNGFFVMSEPPRVSSTFFRIQGFSCRVERRAIKRAGERDKKHMNTRTIPQSIPALVTACARALAGVQTLGATLSIAQNTEARFEVDYFDLVGEPGSLTNLGKNALLNAKRDSLTQARAARRAAVAAGVKFCSDGVDLLKPRFGRSWNPAWLAAGFSQTSIAVPRSNPLPVLLELRNYLRDNPTQEVTLQGFTLVNAEARITALNAAQQGLDAAVVARKVASQNRDGSVKRLRKRLTCLREELDLLLSDTDARWLEFGFTRPVDSRRPTAVTGLSATPGQPGNVLVQYAPSARALDYRVSWKPQVGSGEPTEVGLFADLAVTLSGLPSGTAIEVSVTARNEAGETQPAEVTVVVP